MRTKVSERKHDWMVDSKYPLDYGVYDTTVNECVMTLRGVCDYCLQMLLNEINARCFYYMQKYEFWNSIIFRLTDSFTSNSYNSVPPVIMELMKDVKGFSDIVVRLVRLRWNCDVVFSCQSWFVWTSASILFINSVNESRRSELMTCSQSLEFPWNK